MRTDGEVHSRDMSGKSEPAKKLPDTSKDIQLRQLHSYARGGRGKLMALAGLQKKAAPTSREHAKKPAAYHLTPPSVVKTPKRHTAPVVDLHSSSPPEPDPDWLQAPTISSPKRRLYVDPVVYTAKRLRETEPTPALHGLRNIGNSCYMNAVLQAVVSLACFSADMQRQELTKAALAEDGVYKHLLQIIRKMKCAESSTTINPADLKQAIERNSSRFQGMFQQDAHELLCNLLDQIQEEVYAGYEKPRANLESPKLRLQETVCPTTRNFSCIVEHELECDNCGDSSTVQELFRHLSLDIPQKESGLGWRPCEMQDMVRHFFQDEVYEKTCEKCGFDRCTVRRTIKRLPRVLVLHVKRFCVQSDDGRAHYTKNTDRVGITRALDLDFCCTASTKRPLPMRAANKTKDSCTTSPSVLQPATPLADISNLHGRPAMRSASAEQPLSTADPYDFMTSEEAEREDEDLKKALQESMRNEQTSQIRVDGEAATKMDSQEDRELEHAIALSLQEAAAAGAWHGEGSPEAAGFTTPSHRQGQASPGDRDSPEGTPLVIEVDDSGDDMQSARHDAPGRGKYVLHAIIRHLGTLASAGHFVTDVFDPSRGQWLRHNDSIVSPVSENNVFSAQTESEGYMFFYVHQDLASQTTKAPQMRFASNQKPPVRQYSRRTQLAAILSEGRHTDENI